MLKTLVYKDHRVKPETKMLQRNKEDGFYLFGYLKKKSFWCEKIKREVRRRVNNHCERKKKVLYKRGSRRMIESEQALFEKSFRLIYPEDSAQQKLKAASCTKKHS